MRDPVLSPLARADLQDIGDWIARDNVREADRFVDVLLEACLGLADFPERFRRVPERPDLRVQVHGSYLIIYRANPSVEVVRILHGARDWMSLLDDLG